VLDCRGKRSRLPRTDARHAEPVDLTGIDDAPNCAEAAQEPFGAVCRDAGNGREHSRRYMCVRGTLRVGGPTLCGRLFSAASEHSEPLCAVKRISASDDIDAEIADGEKQAANRGRVQARSFEIALNEEVAPVRGFTKSADLWPEAAARHRRAEISHGLPFDHRSSDEIVADRQRALVHTDSRRSEVVGDATPTLEDIGDDLLHTGEFEYRYPRPLVAVQGTAT